MPWINGEFVPPDMNLKKCGHPADYRCACREIDFKDRQRDLYEEIHKRKTILK